MKILVDAARAQPGLTAVLLGCTLLGTVAGAMHLPVEWHMVRRLAAGAVSGAGCGLIIVATRLLG